MKPAHLYLPLVPFLPGILLFASFLAEPLALRSQQIPPAAAADSHFLPPAANPEFQPTPEDIGDALLVKGRYQAAMESYKKSPSISAAAWNKMGIAYQMLSDPKDAARCYKQSLRLEPQNVFALNNLGTIYDGQGNYAKAEGMYRRALEIDPRAPRVIANLGTNLMIQNRYSQGQEMYKRALALDSEVFDDDGTPVSVSKVPSPQRGAMNYYKAQSFAQAGMIDRAIQHLKKALNEGFTTAADIAQDSSFARLRGNPSFERLMTEHTKTSRP